MPTPEHSDVINAIYRAAAHPELWSDALEVVADHVGAIAGNLVYQAPAGERSFLIPGRMREDLNALYLRHYARNPYAFAYQKLRPGQVAIGNRLVDVKAVEKSAFYADICAPQRISNQIFVSHAQLQRQGGIGGVALFLSSRQSEYEARAAQRLEQLSEHIARAIDFTLLTSQQAGSARLFEELIATMPSAALLLDRQGGIIQTNAAADELLRKGDGLTVRKSDHLWLAARVADESLALSRNIRQALAVARGEDQGLEGALQITRPSGLPPLQVLITPLPPASFSLWEAVNGAARVMVQVVDLQASPDAQAERLRIMVGLTAAETRVAALIVGGLSVATVARALGVSSNTVKTHLARCYDKAGVRTQAALARLLTLIHLAPGGSPDRDLAGGMRHDPSG
jgi:DNA-binding CsgD family transcriptional regulator